MFHYSTVSFFLIFALLDFSFFICSVAVKLPTKLPVSSKPLPAVAPSRRTALSKKQLVKQLMKLRKLLQMPVVYVLLLKGIMLNWTLCGSAVIRAIDGSMAHASL